MTRGFALVRSWTLGIFGLDHGGNIMDLVYGYDYKAWISWVLGMAVILKLERVIWWLRFDGSCLEN